MNTKKNTKKNKSNLDSDYEAEKMIKQKKEIEKNIDLLIKKIKIKKSLI